MVLFILNCAIIGCADSVFVLGEELIFIVIISHFITKNYSELTFTEVQNRNVVLGKD